jgi:hypothetical protein
MKVGVAYNVFDGTELLPYSIKSIRPFVDFICVVYQTTSNFGEENPYLQTILKELKEEGLIDFMYLYEPKIDVDDANNIKWQNGTLNEYKKRNLGISICRENGCDIFMTMDADEVYCGEQFQSALKEFNDGMYDTSFCLMKTYYKEPIYQLNPPEEYYVPLFYKIKRDTKFTMDYAPPYNYPVLCDPTRRVKAGHTRIFTRDEIEMHHFAYVRKDLWSKVMNSSAQMDEISKKKVIHHYEKFNDINDGALFIGLQSHKLKEVPNQFNIEL